MYELIQATDSAWYIDCPAKIGIVRVSDSEVVCIDSGSDKDAGKKILKILNAQGWKLRAVYNTHSHADHIGGNAYLQAQTGCRVFTPGIEQDFTCHTLLEPAFLYGGFPMKELHHKFLRAQESAAEPLTQGALPGNLELVPLPGHSFEMVGFRTNDGAVFLADCVCSEQTLEKYGVSFLWDVAASLETLAKVETMQASCFIPAHAPVVQDIAPLAQRNISAIRSVGETILSLCESPTCFEMILKMLFEKYDMTMTLQQYALVGSTLRSYLTWLHHDGRAEFTFEDNQMLWHRV